MDSITGQRIFLCSLFFVSHTPYSGFSWLNLEAKIGFTILWERWETSLARKLHFCFVVHPSKCYTAHLEVCCSSSPVQISSSEKNTHTQTQAQTTDLSTDHFHFHFVFRIVGSHSHICKLPLFPLYGRVFSIIPSPNLRWRKSSTS